MKAKHLLLATLLSLGTTATLRARAHLAPSGPRAEAQGPQDALARSLGTPKPAAGAAKADKYDLTAHQTLSRVILRIRENYVEPERVKPYEMFLAALDYIQRTQPEVLVDDSQAPARIAVSVGPTSQVFDLGGLDQLWEVTTALRDIFRFLQQHIEDAEQLRNIEYAAINGMLSTLDPHSILLKPESFDEVKLSTRGEFGGLGVVISLRDGALTIIAPIEGTPASQVGLRAKDKIVKIGEESTVNMGLDEAVQRMRGRPDTPVTISIQRKGWSEPKAFTLVRAIIKIESVTAELLEDGVGYIKIKSFQGNTFEDLQAHLLKLRQANKERDLTGLVLDLRNNPGGLLDQAILVSDRFIERGPLVITVGESNRRREVKNAHVGLDESTYPIVVLQNGGSASASEIVAGALKNHDRALVLGQQSFGKGSVQVLYDFKDRSALKLTIAQYLTPGDISIQSVGIVPDVTVTPAVLEKDAIHLFVDDEAPREKDLEKHLEQHGQTKVTANSIRLFHLSEKEREELEGTQAALEAAHDEAIAAAGRFEYDFETRLAHDILRKSKSIHRPKMIEQATQLLEATARSEDDIIAKRMAELGVDWSQAPSPAGPAHAKVTLQTRVQPAPAGPSAHAGAPERQAHAVLAGDTLWLVAEVHNDGATPLYRVYGTTQSDNPLLKNLEFAFGKILPGETRIWQAKVKLPADMAARADEVTLQLGDVHGQTHEMRGHIFVTIGEQQKPNFAYALWLDDDHGNGDGLLQAGEAVSLKVAVTNEGPGDANDVSVAVKNLSGRSVFLDAGRDKLGALAVGQTKVATLHFRVHGPDGTPAPMAAAAGAPLPASPEAPAGAIPDDDALDEADEVARDPVVPKPGDSLNFKLSVWDANLGTPLVEALHFVVAPPDAAGSAPAQAKPATFWVASRRTHVPVFAGANDALPWGQMDAAGSVFLADKRLGRFTRLQPPQRAGSGAAAGTGEARQNAANTALQALFVHNEDVERVARPKRAPDLHGLTQAPPTAAPKLRLDQNQLLVTGEHFVLRGEATSSRSLKDMFVFVGEKKVYFRFLSDIKPEHGQYRHVFEVPMKLAPGTNSVAVFVRESEDLMARRLLHVHRRRSAEAKAGGAL